MTDRYTVRNEDGSISPTLLAVEDPRGILCRLAELEDRMERMLTVGTQRFTSRCDDGVPFFPRCFEDPCYGCGGDCIACDFTSTICERLAAYEDAVDDFEDMHPYDKNMKVRGHMEKEEANKASFISRTVDGCETEVIAGASAAEEEESGGLVYGDPLYDTIAPMMSTDYRERFRAEFLQLKIRRGRLSQHIEKIKLAEREEHPELVPHDCPVRMLEEQLDIMDRYLGILVARSLIENVDLTEV